MAARLGPAVALRVHLSPVSGAGADDGSGVSGGEVQGKGYEMVALDDTATPSSV